MTLTTQDVSALDDLRAKGGLDADSAYAALSDNHPNATAIDVTLDVDQLVVSIREAGTPTFARVPL